MEDIVEVRQCTTSCGPDEAPCPDGIVSGGGGGVVGVNGACLFVDVHGAVEAFAGYQEGYCFAAPFPYDETGCTTVGTEFTVFSDGLNDFPICVPATP